MKNEIYSFSTNLSFLVNFEVAPLAECLSALVALEILFFRVDCLVIGHALAIRRLIVAGPTLEPTALEMSIQMTGESGFVAASVFSALMA